jgi:hypothetical protein
MLNNESRALTITDSIKSYKLSLDSSRCKRRAVEGNILCLIIGCSYFRNTNVMGTKNNDIIKELIWNKLEGVWLPIITPFLEDKIDYKSYKKLIDYYSVREKSGFIPNGTTGECPTIDDYEFEELLEKTVDFNNQRLPIYYGRAETIQLKY